MLQNLQKKTWTIFICCSLKNSHKISYRAIFCLIEIEKWQMFSIFSVVLVSMSVQIYVTNSGVSSTCFHVVDRWKSIMFTSKYAIIGLEQKLLRWMQRGQCEKSFVQHTLDLDLAEVFHVTRFD